MAQTDYLGLPLTLDSDDQMTFLDWRRRIDGNTDSDMVKIDSAIKAANASIDGKQDAITGTSGQIAGFDKNGYLIAQDLSSIGVVSFNGRLGDVSPASGDYTADMVGADKEGAAAAVQTNLDAHSGDTDMHVTASRKNTWDGKQDKLTFDSEPTSGSSNPVTSGGVFSFVATAIESAIGTALGGSY